MKLPSFLSFLKRHSSHTWELIAKTMVEPKNVTSLSDSSLTKLALTGMTTFIFQCTKCSEFKKEEMVGLEESPLDRLMDKVDVGGPEYILREGKTYILMRRPDSPQTGVTLPVR